MLNIKKLKLKILKTEVKFFSAGIFNQINPPFHRKVPGIELKFNNWAKKLSSASQYSEF